MTDQYRLSVQVIKTVEDYKPPDGPDLPKDATAAELPVVVGALDIKIERRFLFDLSQTEALMGTKLEALGLGHVFHVLHDVAPKLPQEEWKFLNIPWTDAPEGQFDPDSIVPLLDIARRNVWWRLEGSAATALVGIVSCGGVERYFDLSRDKIKATEQAAIVRQAELMALEKSETDQSKRDALTVTIEIITCVAGVAGGAATRNAGVLMVGAGSCYAAYDKAVGDAAAARKAAEERSEVGRAGPARAHGGAAVGGGIGGGGQRPHRGN